MLLRKSKVFFLTVSIIFGLLVLFARDVNFSNYGDIQNLPISKELFQETERYDDEQVIQINFSVSESDCKLYSTASGSETINIKGLNSLKDPGKPQLPMASIVKKFLLNTKIIGVKAYSGKYAEIAEKIDIAPAPQAVKWEMYSK